MIRFIGVMMALLALAAPAISSLPSGISLSGLLKDKAVVSLQDGSIRTLKLGGAAVEGMRLLAIEAGKVAVIEVHGKPIRLKLGAAPLKVVVDKTDSPIFLIPDSRGHLTVEGKINGVSMRFLVDTGASLVSIGVAEARSAGIPFRDGKKIVTRTANGPVTVWQVRLSNFQVGDIKLYDVDVAVHEGERLPMNLLGMSALRRMELVPDGGRFILRKRF